MTFKKDPESVLDYTFDWSAWLEDGENIVDQTVTVEDDLNIDSIGINSPYITVWLSGGTSGETYDLSCEIITDNTNARTDKRTMRIQVENR